MKFYVKAAALIMLTVSLTFSACGGGGDTGGGDTETPASTLFANKSYLAPGAICPAGGIQIDMGFDNNKNNVLDADEITKTEYVCNGEDGDDASSHPFVVYTSPTSNETDVELDTVISAVFNTEMDEDTITDETFTVKDSSGNSVEGTVSYSGIVAVFTPDAPLNINMKYAVKLVSTIENENDIAMGYDHKIYFTTNGKAAVIYKSNGADSGTVPVDTSRYNPGVNAPVSTNSGNLLKNDYTFVGWNTKSDGTGTNYAVGSTVLIGTTNVILYAKWSASYTVTYNSNDADSGTPPEDSNAYIEGQNVTVKANTDLVKTGLHFVGWNTNSSGTGTTYAPDAVFQMSNTNVTLYAKWITDPFLSAANPGDKAAVTVGTETFNMVYANNQTNITFPFSLSQSTPVNNSTATLTRKFFMGETEVTNALFVEVLNWAKDNNKISENGTDNLVSVATVKYGNNELVDLDYNTAYMKISYSTSTHEFSVSSGYEDHPVVCVSWCGAIMFCNWLTEMRDGDTTNVVYTGIGATWNSSETVEDAAKTGYRLPSNQEWEYAARYIGQTAPSENQLESDYIAQNVRTGSASLTAGYYWTPASYPSGGTLGGYTNTMTTDYSRFNPYCWYGNNTSPDGNTTAPQVVALKAANQLGLFDMSGNVWEWCFDKYISYNRVFRSGGWEAVAEPLQVGSWYSTPGNAIYDFLGFRIARTQ